MRRGSELLHVYAAVNTLLTHLTSEKNLTFDLSRYNRLIYGQNPRYDKNRSFFVGRGAGSFEGGPAPYTNLAMGEGGRQNMRYIAKGKHNEA